MIKSALLSVGRNSIQMFDRPDASRGLQSLGVERLWTVNTLEERIVDALASAAACDLWSVVVADEVVDLFVFSPPGNLRSFQDLVDLANLRCRALFDHLDAEVAIAADWRASDPFIVSAIDMRVLRAISAALHRSGMKVPPILPRFCWEWNACAELLPSEEIWFLVEREAGFTIAAANAKNVVFITYLESKDGLQVDRALHQAAMRLGVACPTSAYLAGETPNSLKGSATAWKPLGQERCTRRVNARSWKFPRFRRQL